MPNDAIQVELTDESELHCLKLIFYVTRVDEPLQIFLHTTQGIDLLNKLALTICKLLERDSALLLKNKYKVELPKQ